MPAMTGDSVLPFDMPSVQGKKGSAAFDGRLIWSDGGLVLLREAECSLRLADALAACIPERRNHLREEHAQCTTDPLPIPLGIQHRNVIDHGPRSTVNEGFPALL